MIPNAHIANLHAAYEQCTGIQLPLNKLFGHEYAWGCWFKNGWTEADLRLVVSHLRRENPKFFLKMVRFNRLIEDHKNFSELLGEARAAARNAPKPRTERQIVLEAVYRAEPPTVKDSLTVQTVGDLTPKLLDELRAVVDAAPDNRSKRKAI